MTDAEKRLAAIADTALSRLNRGTFDVADTTRTLQTILRIADPFRWAERYPSDANRGDQS